jgi:leucyl-tRNA synthetase
MAYYDYNEIERYWQKYWADNKTFKAENNSKKPKYYVLDMFPYPSGAGLHVGHPLGYIASCIYARYKRLKGFNVLHPMGYDSFGLPAEQYAIQTGQHPAITTKENIARYRQQLDKIGLSFDWDREVRTSDPNYYKWTQWIFIQIYNSWYNNKSNKAEKIESLIAEFEKNGNQNIDAACDENTPSFTAEEWNSLTEEEQQKILLNYRLTYIGESMVNWCPELGTVLANDEVKDGVSERGGHPVVQKKMKQWSMRISAYAQRLLDGLEKIDWTDSIKEVQRNWIGKSEGASVHFSLENGDGKIEVFTTRPDTIFGASFMVLAPEHELVNQITTAEQKAEVEAYILATSKKSERDRLADVKTVSGAFTGAFAIHPFTGNKIPIWIADYVLSGYGTGAVMAVPCGDERDFRFATHFGLDIPSIVEGFTREEAIADKNAKIINSDFLNGLTGYEAIKKCIEEIEKRGFGKRKINYRLRDAVFTRQRYWGEPLPVYFKNDVPYCLSEDELPLQLPEVDKYLPTEDGEPPLARAKDFKTKDGYPYETSTMPGWAGSSWYFLRYMDAHNDQQFVSREAADYWKQVDLYIGGAEHGTGHLLYSRFWCKILFDLGLIGFDEPFQKMINQGMIQGNSAYVFRNNPIVKESQNEGKKLSSKDLPPILISFNKLEDDIYIDEKLMALKNKYSSEGWQVSSISAGKVFYKFPIDISKINKSIISKDVLQNYRKEFKNAFIIEDENGNFHCEREVEKMSKSKFNVVNPDELIEKFGADTLRCYEMFLGPIEQHKPWDTQGIEGTHRFLKKVWNQFHDGDTFNISDEAPTKDELRALHKTIKKMEEDIERYSFNTLVSNMMILLNSLQELKCNKRQILEPFLILLSPMAPHIAEELWRLCGHNESISHATFPKFKEEFLAESAKKYPVSFNGKMRFTVELPTGLSKEDIEKEVMAMEETQKWLEGKSPKKIIVVPEKIVNIVM